LAQGPHSNTTGACHVSLVFNTMLVEGRFLVGLGLALTNCVLASVGFIMQRKAQLLSEAGEVKGVCSIRALGVVLYILAALPDLLSYTLVPQVVCTTVACFRLVLVTFLAHTFLQELVSFREALGMLVCSVGTFICLVYGPKPDEIQEDVMAEELYHPQVWAYLAVGLGLLLMLLVLEHSDYVGRCNVGHCATLPLATGVAFALEKVFNTEIGFLKTPEDMQGLLQAPMWVGMVISIAILGLLDFYLNLRAAARMPVQVFLPMYFALATSLQFFQSVVVFSEFAQMNALHSGLSLAGAFVSLAGAMLINPPRLGPLGHETLQDELELGEASGWRKGGKLLAPEMMSPS